MLAMGLDSKVKILESFPFLNRFIKKQCTTTRITRTRCFVLESQGINQEATRQIIQHIRLCIDGLWLQLKHEVVMEWTNYVIRIFTVRKL